MRRGGSSRKMWWVVVPCTGKKSMKTESRLDIEEILKMKLATITEEEPAETIHDENGGLLTTKQQQHRSSSSCMNKKGKKNHLIKLKMGRFFMPRFSFKQSYVIFITGLAGKSGLHGLPQC